MKNSLFVYILFFSMPLFAKDIRLMVIDSGIDGNHPLITSHLDMNDMAEHPFDYIDDKGHGTHIGYLTIKKTCKQVRLYSCKFFDKNYSDEVKLNKLLNCLLRAHNEHMDYINFSSFGTDQIPEEYESLKMLLSDPNVTMVNAIGNDGRDLNATPCWGSFPACYGFKNLIVVGNLNKSHIKYQSSNYDLKDMKWMVGTGIYSALPNKKMGYMTGSSQAAARYTNILLRQKCGEIHE